MNIKLETDRLYLREFTLADAGMLYDMHQDPAITRYTGDPVPWSSVAQTEEILTDIIFPQYQKGIGRWATHLKTTDEFIGWCGLKDIGGEIDLGYRFIQKYWGNGYASEAAQAVLEFGINEKIPNIIGRADVANVASVKVLKKIWPFYDLYNTVEADGKASVKLVYRY